MILKRELGKEKTDEMKYSHFLCTLERSYQDKLKMAIIQLKCVPCLNKFTATSFSLLHQSPSNSSIQSTSQQQQQQSKPVPQMTPMMSNGNMNRLLKQMSLIVSTELQQIAIDLIERYDDDLNSDKPIKYIKLKEEFKYQPSQMSYMQAMNGGGVNHHHQYNHSSHHAGSGNNNNNNFAAMRDLAQQQQQMQQLISMSSGMQKPIGSGSNKPMGSMKQPCQNLINNIMNQLDMVEADPFAVKAADQTAKSSFIDASRGQISSSARY
jgi:hypothetical protein